MTQVIRICLTATALTSFAALLAPFSASAEAVFFSRSSDIGENNVWVVQEFSEGPNILDMHVRRLANGTWTACSAGKDCSTNEGRLIFGVPLYAPADGVIKTCWRNFDDNPKPGQKLDKVTGANGTTRRIFTAGNHVNIETPDGKMILIAHMKKGSVPSSLCPFNASEADVSKHGQDYPAAAVIPVNQRPQVRRGDLIGYAGNSGNSSGPHVHIHYKPVETDTTEGPSQPLPFVQGWAHPYNSDSPATANGWYKLNNEAITSADGNTMVHPSPFLRRATESAGTVHSADPVFLSTNRIVTAVENGLHNLMLISWDFAGPGDIIRKHEVVEGVATNVRIVAHDSSHVVVAFRDASGNLKLILYHIGVTGTFTRLDDAVAEQAYSLEMTATSGADKKIILAMRRGADDKLKLTVWDIDWSSGSAKLKLLGTRLEQGTVSALALTQTSSFPGAAVAVRTAEDTLKVIPYKMSGDGKTLTRGADYEAGVVSTTFDITTIPKGVVTAMKDSAGVLRLISLETSAAGDIAGSKATSAVNNVISEVRITRTPHASNGNVITAIRDTGGNLRILGWNMDANGSNIRRIGSSAAGAATKIGAAGHFYSVAGQPPRDVLLTTMRDAEGNLKLINWEVNLNP